MGWLAGWDKRIKFDIDYTNKIGGSVTWFPVTVFLTSTQGQEVFVELATDAEYLKIAFTKADGTTELFAEKELFDVSGEKGIFHISRDGWTINADTSIYLYYDKDHADNTTYIGAIDTVAGAAVWDGNYKVVYHMVDATTSTIKDSTSNNNDGTKKGANEPIEAAGKIGLGQDFDGDNDFIITDTDLFSGERTWMVAWKPDDNDHDLTATSQLLTEWDDDDNRISVYGHVNGIAAVHYKSGGVDDYMDHGGYDAQTYYLWHVKTDSDLSKLTFFIDGAFHDDNDATVSVGVGIRQTLGSSWNGSVHGSFFDGIIDEFRVSNTDRPAAWMKGEYNSLWDTLLTYGGEEVRINALFFGSNF